ncbi:hypothetical protein ACS0TY_010279 [Phlomoides rotata]
MKDDVGQEFMGGATEFRSEIIKYATHKGFNFKYTKNDNTYITVVCSELDSQGCHWFIRAKRKSMNTHFVVSKGNLIHKCVENLIVPESNRVGHNVLSNLVVQNVVSDPTIGAKDILKLMNDDYGVDTTYWKAHRSIGGAKDQTFDNYNESYDQLRWYSETIHITNPGSIVELDVHNEKKHFERIFIAFNACIQGFKSCRPMLH